MKTIDIIRDRLAFGLNPTLLEIDDESAKHAGHAGAKPGGETHFRVKIISDKFEGMNRVKRHQLVYSLLSDLMNNPIHALAIEAKTPGENH